MPPHAFALPQSPAALRIFGRLSAWYGLSVLLVFLLTSELLAEATGRQVLYPDADNLVPLLLPAVLLGLFYAWQGGAFEEDPPRPASIAHEIAAGAAFLCAIILTYLATHPSGAQFSALQMVLQRHPLTGMTLTTALLRFALFLPSIPLFFLLLPYSFIRRHRFALLFCLLTMTGWLLASVFDVLFYTSTIPLTLKGSAWILSLFSQNVTLDTANRMLQLDDFSVYVGTVCGGFSLLVLFGGFFGLYWSHASSQRTFSRPRAVLIALAGLAMLYFLNIVRIAAIMLVGNIAPDFGTMLFHGVIGTALFVVFCLLLLRVAIPMMIARKQRS